MHSTTRLHAGSFGAAAAAYQRGRPAYPEAALDWLLPEGGSQGAAPIRVLDLGAGTGKLTQQLVARSLDVVAVEPSEAMLSELRRSLPDVEARAGSAEAIPCPDETVDVVLVAQAWHWVEPRVAVPEVARVLKPGGRLGLIWNCRQESEGWTGDLGRLMGHLGSMEDNSRNPPVGPPFGAIERQDFRWSNPITLEALVDLVASRSYVIVLPDEERRKVLDEVRAIAAREPGFAEGGLVPMPYVTRCSRAILT
ncbi:MAG: class I SAM-dependent methyltransferase [Janthinobacterium lividum]